MEDDLRDYLSCENQFNSDRTKAWLGQPHFLANLKRKFGKDVHCMRGTKTPGTPSFRIVFPINEDEKISSEKQKLFCSGVGMLQYLVKHSRPDIANAIRELPKVLDGANTAVCKEIHQVIKYFWIQEIWDCIFNMFKEVNAHGS